MKKETSSSNIIIIEKKYDNEEHPIIHCMSHSRETIWAVAILYPNIHDIENNECMRCDNQKQYLHDEPSLSFLQYQKNDLHTHPTSSSSAYVQQPVFRGSDDFWPNDPASHGPHIFTNAFNSL